MMRRSTLAPALVLVAGCSGGGTPDKTATERIVHDYLLAHPEIIPEAMTALQSRDASRSLAANRAAVETPFPGAVAGNPKGDVTLVEFFDYACPYCRAAHGDVKRLIAADPKLRVVYREFPVLSEESGQASLAALAAARQGRYAAFHDALFETAGRIDDARTVAALHAAGVDERRAAADLAEPALKAEIRHNLDLGRTLGLSGTPTFVVGTRLFSGAVGYNKLAAAIAAARKVHPTG